MKTNRKYRIVHNLDTGKTILFRHHFKPHAFHNLTAASILRFRRNTIQTQKDVYKNISGENCLAYWYRERNTEIGQAGLSVLTALTSVCFFGYALALILYAGLHHVSLYAAFVWSIKAILAIFGL